MLTLFHYLFFLSFQFNCFFYFENRIHLLNVTHPSNPPENQKHNFLREFRCWWFGLAFIYFYRKTNDEEPALGSGVVRFAWRMNEGSRSVGPCHILVNGDNVLRQSLPRWPLLFRNMKSKDRQTNNPTTFWCVKLRH